MGAPDLFIAVVTHARTSFPEARGSDGAAARIAQFLESRGLEVALVVEDRNLWDEQGGTARSGGESSYREELLEEWRWRGFLGIRNVPWMARQGLRLGRALLQPRSQHGSMAQRRLLNIEMAHRSMWQQGLDSGAPVVLIIEDDAEVDDVEDCAEGIRDLLLESWDFVNLSLSFNQDELGITTLLDPSGISWAGTASRSILRARRPVTNTVCAIAYRREFLGRLLSHWESMALEPVLPIDWKMNRALRTMVETGQLEPQSSLWIEPGPLVQRSIHPHTPS